MKSWTRVAMTTICFLMMGVSSMAADFYSLSAKKIDGGTQVFSEYKGKVLLIVNVASKCGYTPQYEGLEALYKKYQSQGLVIVGFPCNQFFHQEPADNQEIQKFCKLNYGVTFPLMSKIEVNGDHTDPIYTWLKEQNKSGDIKWNFTKFLIGKNGQVIGRYESKIKPDELVKPIEAALGPSTSPAKQ